jgi:hypothetical protein
MRVRSNLTAGEIVVYGAEWCGWTQKQLDYLDKNGIAYQFVDCAKQACPDFVDGFPTIMKDGLVIHGYKAL